MTESEFYVVLLILFNVLLWIILSLIPHFKYKNKVFIIISFVSLWLFLAIREPYSDAVVYGKYFQQIKTNDFSSAFINRWDVLFNALLFGIRLITNDVHVMMGIIAVITLIGPFSFIKRYSNNYMLSIIIFIAIGSYSMQFYVLRQAIAMSVFLFGFHFLDQKKFLRYCIAIVIASLFHKTAIILLLLYPLINVPPSKYKNIACAIVTFIVMIFSSQLSDLLTSSFYKEYIEDFSSGNGIILFIFYALIFSICKLLANQKDNKKENSIMYAGIFTIIFQFLAIINNRFCRIANYTRDSFIIMIPNSVQSFNAKSRIAVSIIIIIICIFFVVASNNIEGYNILLLAS